MLAAMRCLGAKNATADPRQLAVSATEASPRPPTPGAAVLPLLASSPSGAKVRQVGDTQDLLPFFASVAGCFCCNPRQLTTSVFEMSLCAPRQLALSCSACCPGPPVGHAEAR